MASILRLTPIFPVFFNPCSFSATVDITINYMFHKLFQWAAKSQCTYLRFRFLSFFHQWLAVTIKSIWWFFLLINTKSGFIVYIWYSLVSQSPWEFVASHFLEQSGLWFYLNCHSLLSCILPFTLSRALVFLTWQFAIFVYYELSFLSPRSYILHLLFFIYSIFAFVIGSKRHPFTFFKFIFFVI